METFHNISRFRSSFISNGTKAALKPERLLAPHFSEKSTLLTQPPQ